MVKNAAEILKQAVEPIEEIIHDFSFALLVGVFIGTYSSIFIASVFLVYWDSRKTSHR